MSFPTPIETVDFLKKTCVKLGVTFDRYELGHDESGRVVILLYLVEHEKPLFITNNVWTHGNDLSV